jgi:hypothetical protein
MADRVYPLLDGTTLVETGERVYPLPGGSVVEVIAAPFQINSSTGEITIADTTGLAAGQEWEVVVQATDAASATDDATITINTINDPKIGKKAPLPMFFH